MKPFPFYYKRLPTFREVYESLQERDRLMHQPNIASLEESWFTVCMKHNIFQLWNKEYIEVLALEIHRLVGDDFVLEVAAGDGMLSHWLRLNGVNIKATDNMSWHNNGSRAPIETHSELEELDAISAIRKYKPRMVVASWLPYGSELDCEILDEEPEYLILMGEGNGGCTGSTKFWGDWDEEKNTPAYWRQKGYTEKDLEYRGQNMDESINVDTWNIARTDYPWNRHHGHTTLYSRQE